ncbi:MAG: Hsp20/alpha crystallin family protein [Anaerolineales bacterium]|nr:Hsp20/alpha crystallin family protein [Anaerolineales bacterium]
MPTIIRKSDKPSDSATEHHPLRPTVGWQVQVHANIWSPPTDMYETDDSYTVRMEIAGMREADFTVSIEGGFLVVSGSRPDVTERRAYHQMEIRCGKFYSAVGLPGPIDLENARAEYKDGFFIVALPKIKPSQIAIQEE